MPLANYLNKISLYFLVLLLALFFAIVGCRKDFDYSTSSGQLEFSLDTVFLDTIFTNIGSSTYTLKVYNRENENINIPFIGLENGQESGYRLNVDGIAGKEFNNVPLLAKDSMFVFIETTFDINAIGENEFLYTDAIRFDASSNSQKVHLVTLVRDAVFLYPQTIDGSTETLVLGTDEEGNEIGIEGFFLEDAELNFTNEKPYVIYGYAAVGENKELVVDPGTRIHFHKGSGILVTSGASLKVNGMLSEDQDILENAVIFESDRLEPSFEDVSGQWGAIWLSSGSIENLINHAVIKNATIGLLVEGGAGAMSPTLSLQNTTITNSSISNLWGRATSITGENLVLGNAGQTSLHCNLGGSYNFKHITIANYWTNGLRNTSALAVDNFIELSSGETIVNDLTEASFANCIVDGNRSIELFLQKDNSAAFNYSFMNSAIKFNDSNGLFEGNPLYDFNDFTVYQEVLLNVDLGFIDTTKNLFGLTENSQVIDKGDIDTGSIVPFDILGIDRIQSPDIGAFEFILEN